MCEAFKMSILLLEHQMKAMKQKILLLIDGGSIHKKVPRNVFLLPDHTSIMHHPDQGIIHAGKLHYRSQLVWQTMASISVDCHAGYADVQCSWEICEVLWQL